MPNGRCRMHGGKSLVGPASPALKHGRYSRYLPTRLAARYQEAQQDTDLLALRDEVALLDARLADVLQRVDSGETGGLWLALREALAAFLAAKAEGGVQGIRDMTTHLATMQDLIEQGAADAAAWAEIRALLQDRRRLVESERKRLVEMQQMITSEQAMVLLAAIVDTVRRHVHDRPTLAAISADLAQLSVRAGGGSLVAS